MPQCETCGSNVPEGEAVCPDCGMDMTGASPSLPISPTAETMPAAPSLDASAELATAPAPSVSGPGAHLALKRGGALASETYPLGVRVLLGRFDPETGPVDVDLAALPEAVYVSRHHAEVWKTEDGSWFIRDLGSHNGTFVRPAGQGQFERVSGERPLSDGDEIALGNARFEFRAES